MKDFYVFIKYIKNIFFMTSIKYIGVYLGFYKFQKCYLISKHILTLRINKNYHMKIKLFYLYLFLFLSLIILIIYNIFRAIKKAKKKKKTFA